MKHLFYKITLLPRLNTSGGTSTYKQFFLNNCSVELSSGEINSRNSKVTELLVVLNSVARFQNRCGV